MDRINNIEDFFPDQYIPRPAQIQIITEIEKAIQRGKKYIIIQAPTGVGKSAVSVAVGRYSENAYICTSLKSLQKQYITEFPEIKSTKGRQNFKCLEAYDDKLCTLDQDTNLNCKVGLCSSEKHNCDRKPTTDCTEFFAGESAAKGKMYWKYDDIEKCKYWENKMAGLNSQVCCHNYKYLLTESTYAGDFGERQFVIADEGHNIESNIIDMIKVEISNNTLGTISKYSNKILNFTATNPKYENKEKLNIHYNWILNIKKGLPAIIKRIKDERSEKLIYLLELKELNTEQEQRNYFYKYYDENERTKILNSKVAGDTPTKLIQEELGSRLIKLTFDISVLGDDSEKLDDLNTRITKFIEDFAINKKWVVIETRFNNDPTKNITLITFQPLFIHQYAKKYFFNLGNIIIIMSATILNPVKMAHDLGIKRDEYKYISIEPQFKTDSNKIYNLAIANFETNMDETPVEKETFWRQVIEKIDFILSQHQKEKGIIHGNTHDICKQIKEYSKYSDRILIHSDNENPDNLNYRQQKIDEHCNSKTPTVLCSPSMAEGVDLFDDRSRFQILVKIPYPDQGNEWVRARMDNDIRYFKTKTAITICQAIGRSVRNHDDWCITYTLDSRFIQYMKWDTRLNELFNRHEMPLSDLTRSWKQEPIHLEKLLTRIKRKEKVSKKTPIPRLRVSEVVCRGHENSHDLASSSLY